jgi:hypothetical protein
VQVAGSPSWRFEESDGHLLSLALAVRDGCDLPVPGGPGVPPPLVAPPPAAGNLTPGQRREAARQWAVWWADLVDLEARRLAPDRAAVPAGPALLDALEAAGAPPDFAGLADLPELRSAARATPGVPRAVPDRAGGPHGTFAYDLVRQVAEDVAFDRSVEPARVTGAAVVLDVQGLWWHEIGTGALLCSRAAAEDPRAAHQVLRRAFESGLRRT